MKSKVKNKSKLKLDSEELTLEKELAEGLWTEAPVRLTKEIVEAVNQGLGRQNRDAKINVRMNRETLQLLQNQAKEEGIGYQTLIGSVLHKYAHGKFVNTDDVQKILPMLEKKKLA